MSKTKRALIWATLSVALLGASGYAYWKYKPHKFIRMMDTIGYTDKPKTVTLRAYDGKEYTYSKALVPQEVFGLHGDNCALYLRTVGNMMGVDYRRADHSWELPGRNNVAWTARNENDRSYESKLQFGRAVCIYNPLSMWNGEGIPFTHVAFVVGKSDGRWVVWHDYHGTQRMDYLDWVLDNLVANDETGERGRVVQVMAPRNDPEFVKKPTPAVEAAPATPKVEKQSPPTKPKTPPKKPKKGGR